MDPLSIPVAMFTILMRRVIDSFYRAPIPKNVSSSMVPSSNYSTYTILAAALWFFYSQFAKKGLPRLKQPLMAIKDTPAVNDDASNQTAPNENTTTLKISNNEENSLQTKEITKRKRKRTGTCVKFIMKRCKKTIFYTTNSLARCCSCTDTQFLSKHFRRLTTRSLLSLTSSQQNLHAITSPRKRRIRVIQWKFEGEPIAKKTRSGHIYGYINLLKY